MSSLFLERSIPKLEFSDLNAGTLTFMDLADVVAKTELVTQRQVHWRGCAMTLKASICSAQRPLGRVARGYMLAIEGVPFGVKDILIPSHFRHKWGRRFGMVLPR